MNSTLILATILLGSTHGALAVDAEATTNGIMRGYVVQDSRGRVVCRDPFVQNQFRGPTSYITCQPTEREVRSRGSR